MSKSMLGLAAAVALGLGLVGCEGSASAASKRGAESPEAVFKEAQRLLVPDKDMFEIMGDLMPLLSDGAGAQVCGMSVLMASFSTMGLSQDKMESAGNELHAILAKHGANWAKGQDMGLFGNQDEARKKLVTAFAGVSDRGALIQAVGKFCNKNSKDGQVPKNEARFVGSLREVTEKDGVVTAKATVSKNGSEQPMDLRFVQQNGRWFLDIFMQ